MKLQKKDKKSEEGSNKRKKIEHYTKVKLTLSKSRPRKKGAFGTERGQLTKRGLFLSKTGSAAKYSTIVEYDQTEGKLTVPVEDQDFIFDIAPNEKFEEGNDIKTECIISRDIDGLLSMTFPQYSIIYEYEGAELAKQMDLDYDGELGLLAPESPILNEKTTNDTPIMSPVAPMDLDDASLAPEMENLTKHSFLATSSISKPNVKKAALMADEEADMEMKSEVIEKVKIEKNKIFESIDARYQLCKQEGQSVGKVLPEFKSSEAIASYHQQGITIVVGREKIFKEMGEFPEVYELSELGITDAETIIDCQMFMTNEKVFLITNNQKLYSWKVEEEKANLIGENCIALKSAWSTSENQPFIVASFADGNRMIFKSDDVVTTIDVPVPKQCDVKNHDFSFSNKYAAFLNKEENQVIVLDVTKGNEVLMQIDLPFRGVEILSKDDDIIIIGAVDFMVVNLKKQSAVRNLLEKEIINAGLTDTGKLFLQFGNARDGFYLCQFHIDRPKCFDIILIHEYLKNARVTFDSRRGVNLFTDFSIFEFLFDRGLN